MPPALVLLVGHRSCLPDALPADPTASHDHVREDEVRLMEDTKQRHGTRSERNLLLGLRHSRSLTRRSASLIFSGCAYHYQCSWLRLKILQTIAEGATTAALGSSGAPGSSPGLQVGPRTASVVFPFKFRLLNRLYLLSPSQVPAALFPGPVGAEEA